jgi:hypothetical protein
MSFHYNVSKLANTDNDGAPLTGVAQFRPDNRSGFAGKFQPKVSRLNPLTGRYEETNHDDVWNPVLGRFAPIGARQ